MGIQMGAPLSHAPDVLDLESCGSLELSTSKLNHGQLWSYRTVRLRFSSDVPCGTLRRMLQRVITHPSLEAGQNSSFCVDSDHVKHFLWCNSLTVVSVCAIDRYKLTNFRSFFPCREGPILACKSALCTARTCKVNATRDTTESSLFGHRKLVIILRQTIQECRTSHSQQPVCKLLRITLAPGLSPKLQEIHEENRPGNSYTAENSFAHTYADLCCVLGVSAQFTLRRKGIKGSTAVHHSTDTGTHPIILEINIFVCRSCLSQHSATQHLGELCPLNANANKNNSMARSQSTDTDTRPISLPTGHTNNWDPFGPHLISQTLTSKGVNNPIRTQPLLSSSFLR